MRTYTAQPGETNGPDARAIIPADYRGLLQAPEDCKKKVSIHQSQTRDWIHGPLLKSCTAPVDELDQEIQGQRIVYELYNCISTPCFSTQKTHNGIETGPFQRH